MKQTEEKKQVELWIKRLNQKNFYYHQSPFRLKLLLVPNEGLYIYQVDRLKRSLPKPLGPFKNYNAVLTKLAEMETKEELDDLLWWARRKK